ncbi:D-glycero-beta-D-manno-heptose-7-phosphate kinase [soil metagenome]
MLQPTPDMTTQLDSRSDTAPSRDAVGAARVLIVGDAMLDRYWFGAVDRISPEAPVPVVKISREEERLGGAANVALNVKALGAQATLMTVVGEDEPAQLLQKMLHREGIATLLGKDPSCHTIVKLRIIGRSQQLLRVDFESTPDHEVLATMLTDYERVLGDHDVVLFSDYGKGGLTHIPRMIELARAANKPVLVDPKGSDFSRYAGATAITPNRAELEVVIGRWGSEAQLQQRAQALREELHLEGLVLTRSEEGMSLFDTNSAGAEESLHVPAMAREVFDVTGAGDTVIATLAAMLGCGLSLRQAVPIANRAGAIVVGKFGTATVSHEELFA